MKISPPSGPAEGPASACKSDCKSSGSSESACKSSPRKTVAVELLDGSVETLGPALSCTVTCCVTDATFIFTLRDCAPDCRTILAGCACVRSGADTRTVYLPAGTPLNEYDPSLPEVVTLATPAGPLSVTVAAGTTAPDSSRTCPRNVAVCAQSGRETTIRASGKT